MKNSYSVQLVAVMLTVYSVSCRWLGKLAVSTVPTLSTMSVADVLAFALKLRRISLSLTPIMGIALAV